MIRLLAFILVAVALPAAAQESRVAGLVVAVGDGAGRADAVQAGLQAIGAETLRADNPNNAEMRSLLMRFADVAETKDVAVIYLDAPIAQLGERDFVLPAGVRLDHANDLLTRALPLSAFGRAAAVAGEGGGVFVSATDLGPGVPDGIARARTAPQQRIGMTPVVLSTAEDARALVQILSAMGRAPEVELGALIQEVTAMPGSTTSAMPERAIYLMRAEAPRAAEPAAARTGAGEPSVPTGYDAVDEAAAVEPAAATDAAADGPQTAEQLAALEQALSRSAKRRIQLGLRQRGFYAGLIDGIIGDQTRAAIRDYQAANGVAVTGYLTQGQILRLQQN